MHTRRLVRFSIAALILFYFIGPTTLAADKAASGASERFFTETIQPLLAKHCVDCHGGEKTSGGLDLTKRAGLIGGGDSGEAIDRKSPKDSLLLEAINYETYEMPPSGQLPAEQIALITRWVEMGAPFPGGNDDDAPPRPVAHEITDEHRAHWSFQPVVRPESPVVVNSDWGRSPIDQFILAKLEQAKLPPAPPVDKRALLRRVYYNLIGLPPTPEAVEAFVNDDSPDALANVVDDLLESPHYGEKWGRHWLDLVRYAETNSYERDAAKPHVWRYRDYVISSLNQDKPYDQFVREQLAGDELPNANGETLTATGFYRLGLWDDEPVDREQALYDGLDDVVKTTSQVFLGLTLDCARCHEHKLDPIPQRDYYRYLAFFQGMNPYGVRGGGSVNTNSLRPLASPTEADQHNVAVQKYKKQLAVLEQELRKTEQVVKGDFEPVEHEEFRHEQNRVALVTKRAGTVITKEQAEQYRRSFERRRELKRSPPKPLAQVLCVTEIGADPRATHVLVRGNANVKGDAVSPGFPEVLGVADPKIPPPPTGAKTCGHRTVLADWIACPDNPLTARVMANRLWQYHFGRGIVETPNDFGLKGAPPTHPLLLDWLAAELIDGGWKLKRFHRMLILSSTYQMSSIPGASTIKMDPTNALFSRFNMRRLTSEEIRDSMLAVNGSLNAQMGGPSIFVTIEREVLAGQSRPGSGWGNSPPDQQARRSIYIHVKRSLRPPLLEVYDAADTDNTCPVRFASTQPTQALTMLNSRFVGEQAKVLAAFVSQRAGESVEKQAKMALARIWQRPPSNEEVTQGVKLIASLTSDDGMNQQQAIERFCLVAYNLNEFLYLD